MYRNSRAVTGTNDVPLTNRRWGGGGSVADDRAPPPPPPSGGGGGGSYDDRGRGREERQEPAGDQPRKRRSRWGDAGDKIAMPGLPTAVVGNVSQTELDNYAIHVRLEEINRKLQSGDIVPPERYRSPSPPPQYDGQGRRTNTREVRYRKKLEDERMRLLDKAIKADPNFRPPAEYAFQKRNNRPQEKVYIPAKEFPEINFFGLLVGPRGNSLKNMENNSGAKISIRGKGSVKPGKERNDQFANDETDELHCLVMADTQEKVDKCVKLINTVIETAASTPEGQNDHKRNQLRELASLNGTLRDDENQLCQNCGEKGHRKYECPQARTFSANVICRQCGGAGHMARDCFQRGGPGGAPANIGAGKPASQFDSEYASLMAELGEGGSGPGSGQVAGMITNGPANGAAGGAGGAGGPPAQKIPPWRVPENWFSNRPPQHNNMMGGYGGQNHMGGGGGGYQGYQQQQQQGGYGGAYGQHQQQQQGYQPQAAGAGYGQGGYDAATAAAWAAQGYGAYGQGGADQGAYAAYYAALQQQQQPTA